MRGITFGGFLGVGLRFTPLGEPSRLFAGCIAIRFQIIDSRHYLIHASAPRALLVPTCCGRIKRKTCYVLELTFCDDTGCINRGLTFLTLLLYSLGLLAGFVALLEVESARPRVGICVAFRPLTLYVSARRGAAGCCISRRETSIETIGRNVDQANREREREREMERKKKRGRQGGTFKVDRERLLITPFIYVCYIYRRSIFATAR